jgi:penicillin-binding protein 1B
MPFVSQADTGSAPYFVDMVRDHLLERISESDLESQSFRVYTTLDPNLQKAAAEALTEGMAQVDARLKRRYARWKKKGEPAPQAQAALVALDPKTGQILALVGGRNYGESQLNHILARRQPGSSFKPFVYAAAFDSAVDGTQPLVTPDTTVEDEPTTFEFDGKEYAPNNYGAEFMGTVTLRQALTHSLNVATVKVAEMVGYDRVVAMARQMGLDPSIRATPAMALGAYDMTPLEVAAGYTILADGGVRAEPYFVERVENGDGVPLEENGPRTRSVLDPRVAYLVTNVLENVVNQGTGGVVRQLGFTAPAAGKTGTSRDGWFAGYTSNLLCVVWVGFDDNRDLGLAGSESAAPIWAEFMKRAVTLPGYRNAHEFPVPDGVVTETIDPASGEVATAQCPTTETDAFILGTQPTVYCHLHGGGGPVPQPVATPAIGGNPATGVAAGKAETPPGSNGGKAGAAAMPGAPATGAAAKSLPRQAAGKAPAGQKKKGLFKKIFGIFRDTKSPSGTTGKPKS